jgi:HSP20 family protein
MSDRQSFTDMESWLDRMNREFREAARQWGEATDPWTGSTARPSADVIDREDDYVVTVDLPGFTKDDIDVRLVEETLLISAEHEEQAEETDERYIRRERHHRSLSRRITLPESIDREAIDASMRHGVLTVTIPKAATVEKGTEIAVD